MKTDFLKNLGITEQATIDAIMAENGRDIEKVKKDTSSFETEIEGLKAQLNERDTQLKELKKTAGDNEKLTSRIAELEEANKTTKAEYESKLDGLRRENEIESKLRDAKAKNVKAVRALLTSDEDIDKQIKKLTEDESTSFLFEVTNTKTPAGTDPVPGNGSNPANNQPKSLADAIRASLTNNN